ncbi:acyltransferase family protein [Planctomonas sp. JC2975]|uniref:acyltransferase family protein n=1 Tax=Planctomonas sp. JC2975 TaxID=2729626 RepID=UPI0014732398|nr:acyltransferase family protein [Planctomonas sp. JC2975]NNC10328.1 acyltransferase family protein [Planctomonas sp. JC2975]
MVDPAIVTTATDVGRIVWMDRLRFALTVLVVAHHSADTYSTIADWYVDFGGRDPSATALSVVMLINQLFFMGVFFLLAGYFTPRAYDRRGPALYIRDRLVRLGIPLVAYIVVIRPLCLLPGGIVRAQQAAAAHQNFSLPGYLAFDGDPGVAWFLEVLLVFGLGYVALRLLRSIHPNRPATDRSSAGSMRPTAAAPDGSPRSPRILGLGVVVVAVAALTFVWQWLVPLGTYWPFVGLPSPTFLPQYLVFFTVGALAARRGWLAAFPRWWALPAMPAMLIGAALFVASLGTRIDAAHLAASAEQAIGSALFAIGITVLLVVVFRTWLSGPATRLTRFLSDQTFLVYLLHPLVLTWVAVAIMGLNWPSAAWAGLLFAIGAPMSWGAAWLLRRIRVVRRIV